MTFIINVFHGELITTTLVIKIWSSRVMWRSAHNEAPNVWLYHCSMLFQVTTYMMSLMASCVVIVDLQMDNALDACQMCLIHVHTHTWKD
jgi:hypothetical protein